jgi:hypothetical protein
LNELSTLQAVIEQAESALRDLEQQKLGENLPVSNIQVIEKFQKKKKKWLNRNCQRPLSQSALGSSLQRLEILGKRTYRDKKFRDQVAKREGMHYISLQSRVGTRIEQMVSTSFQDIREFKSTFHEKSGNFGVYTSIHWQRILIQTQAGSPMHPLTNISPKLLVLH